MREIIEITSNDPILESLDFIQHQDDVERRYRRFLPKPGEPNTKEISTAWGDTLTAKAGDYLVSSKEAPEDQWPVNADVFEDSYEITGPNSCVKTAVTELVPLTCITGDEEQLVTVHTLEGPETVRAGDFFLARGVKGEIWPIEIDKIAKG
jgi:hypothetical protein